MWVKITSCDTDIGYSFYFLPRNYCYKSLFKRFLPLESWGYRVTWKYIKFLRVFLINHVAIYQPVVSGGLFSLRSFCMSFFKRFLRVVSLEKSLGTAVACTRATHIHGYTQHIALFIYQNFTAIISNLISDDFIRNHSSLYVTTTYIFFKWRN